MSTLRLFTARDFSIPASASWYLADLGEFRGKQQLYTQQSAQRLKTLRVHALIESAVSSNRIEGVSVDPSRVRDVLVAPKSLFRDRDEEEVRRVLREQQNASVIECQGRGPAARWKKKG